MDRYSSHCLDVQLRKERDDNRRRRESNRLLVIVLAATVVVGLLLVIASVARGDVRPATVVEDRVDVLEVNELFDDDGKHVFKQLIGWDLYDSDCQYHAVFWRLVNRQRMEPYNGQLIWLDGDCLRRVRYESERRTHLQHDPECADREFLPREMRRELGKRP